MMSVLHVEVCAGGLVELGCGGEGLFPCGACLVGARCGAPERAGGRRLPLLPAPPTPARRPPARRCKWPPGPGRAPPLSRSCWGVPALRPEVRRVPRRLQGVPVGPPQAPRLFPPAPGRQRRGKG